MPRSRKSRNFTLDSKTYETLEKMKKETKLSKSRLIDEAVEDLEKKYKKSGKWVEES